MFRLDPLDAVVPVSLRRVLLRQHIQGKGPVPVSLIRVAGKSPVQINNAMGHPGIPQFNPVIQVQKRPELAYLHLVHTGFGMQCKYLCIFLKRNIPHKLLCALH